MDIERGRGMNNHKEKVTYIRESFKGERTAFNRYEVNVLLEEISLLEAEVERLKQYTNPRLFAAASGVLEAWDDYNQVSIPSLIEALEEQFIPRLIEAVAWWDSLPFDPEKDTEKLPKYEA